MKKSTQSAKKDILPLQRAVNALRIDDISFLGSRSETLEDFEPKYDIRTEALSYQTKNIVSSSGVIRVGEIDDPESFLLFKVIIELGIRISCTEEVESDTEDPEILSMVEAEIAAYYKVINDEIIDDNEALDAFAMSNACFNVWPYWREFAASQLTRMNMPKITLPFHMKPSNSDSVGETKKASK